jgi:hypothetical protein
MTGDLNLMLLYNAMKPLYTSVFVSFYLLLAVRGVLCVNLKLLRVEKLLIRAKLLCAPNVSNLSNLSNLSIVAPAPVIKVVM